MGSGYRTFTAGEVLTASNVQNYLQDQAVMVFGSTALRSSGIGTANFEEGMLTYLTDVDKLQVYTGSSFVDVYPAASSNQGLTLINTTSFSGVSSQSINDVFSATYTNYRIIVDAVSSSATAVPLNFRFRVSGTDNTSTNYRIQTAEFTTTSIIARGTGLTTWEFGALQSATHNVNTLEVKNPFQAFKPVGFSVRNYDTTGNIITTYYTQGLDVDTSYTGCTIYPTSGTMTGVIKIYAYN